jgi:hypothetical protein
MRASTPFLLITAAVKSLSLAWRYRKLLSICSSETSRYYCKAINLALCYAGFSPDSSIYRFKKLGEAAFVSTAYDVITDWRAFGKPELEAFKVIMSECKLNPRACSIAMDLYCKEIEGTLNDDGLERGEMAMLFISEMADFGKLLGGPDDIKNLGWFSQAVDDILDYEDDVKYSEMNALTSPGRIRYLESALSYPWLQMRSSLPHSYILDKAVGHALRKGAQLFSLWSASPVGQNSHRCPGNKVNYESQPEVASCVRNEA